MRGLALLSLVLFLSVAARADEVDDKWRAFMSDTSQSRLSAEVVKRTLNSFIDLKYGPALIKAAAAVPDTAGDVEQQRKGQLAREALAWARPREDALGDLVLSRAYRQGLGVEANLFESLRLLRRPYFAQIPEALETLLIALDQGTGLPQNTPAAMEATARLMPAFQRANMAPSALPYQLLLKPIEELRDLRVPQYLEEKNIGWIFRKDIKNIFGKILIINKGISPEFVDFQNFIIDFLILRNNGKIINVDTRNFSGESLLTAEAIAIPFCMNGIEKNESKILEITNPSTIQKANAFTYLSCALSGKIPTRPPTSGLSLLDKNQDILQKHYFYLAAGAARFGYGREKDTREALSRITIAIASSPEDGTPKVLRGMIYDEEGPLSNRERARSDLAEGGKACLDTFFEFKKDLEKDAQRDREKWITSASVDPSYNFKTRWSPLTGLMSNNGRRAMAECAQTALSRAAELGSPDAAYAVTRLPADEPGIVQLSKERRQALLEQAVDGGIIEANAALAEILIRPRIIIDRFRLVDQNGQTYDLGPSTEPPPEPPRRPIQPLLEEAAAKGDPKAQWMLGAALANSSSTTEDAARGWQLLRTAAETRTPEALYRFGLYGTASTAPSEVQAAALDALTEAAEQDFAPAAFELARLEMKKPQTPAQQRRSVMRLYTAAQANIPGARDALIAAFDKGIGIGAPSPWLANLWKSGQLP